MAAWLPLIKTALPYVVQVLSIAVPAFTSKSDDKKIKEIIPQQITELQSAAIQNAESVKILAQQLKETIEGVDAAAVKIQQEITALRRLCTMAIFIAVISLLVTMLVIVNQ